MLRLLILFASVAHTTVSYEIQQIALPQLKYPDALYWDASTRNLYFVDLFSTNATLCRYAYETNSVICSTIEGETYPAFIVPVKCCKNLFAIGFGHAVKIVRWFGGNDIAQVVRTVFNVEADTTSFINKGVTELKKLFGNVQSSTGIAVDKKAKKLYHLDGCHGIVGFDWDSKTGNLCNGRNAFNFNLGSNIPSYDLIGLNVDTHGFLYTGAFGGSSVWVIDPRTGSIVDEIELPTELILTPIFGGPHLDELFVTSGTVPLDLATGKYTDQELTSSAGSLFRIIGYGTKGFAGNRVKL